MQDAWRGEPLTDGETARLQRRARLAALANEWQALGLYDVITGQHQTACQCHVTSSGAACGCGGEGAVATKSEQERPLAGECRRCTHD